MEANILTNSYIFIYGTKFSIVFYVEEFAIFLLLLQ